MSYTVKEIYYTIQGEGAHTGRPAVFLRFAGCNLWTGYEADRASAVCDFCDTDFVGTDGPNGGTFASAAELAEAVAAQWPRDELTPRSKPIQLAANGTRPPGRSSRGLQCEITHPHQTLPKPFVVCTGGEPLLQLDGPAVRALHEDGFEIAVETNGTCIPPDGIDWICVSPKAGAEQVLKTGHELKLVFPQPGAEPQAFEQQDFRHFFLQPMDGPNVIENTRLAVRYCLDHPRWRLSVQMHKLLGLP